MKTSFALTPHWRVSEINVLAPKFADKIVDGLFEAALRLSADISHQLFEVSKNLDEADKEASNEAADTLVAVAMMRIGMRSLRRLGFPRCKALLIALDEKLLTDQELESVLALARGKTRKQEHRTGATALGGVGVEKFSATPSPVATPASTESGVSRSSCRAEVPEARPRKGVSGRRKPTAKKKGEER